MGTWEWTDREDEEGEETMGWDVIKVGVDMGGGGGGGGAGGCCSMRESNQLV